MDDQMLDSFYASKNPVKETATSHTNSSAQKRSAKGSKARGTHSSTPNRPVMNSSARKRPVKKANEEHNFFTDFNKDGGMWDNERVPTFQGKGINPLKLGFVLDHRQKALYEYAKQHNIVGAFSEELLNCNALVSKYENPQLCPALLNGYLFPTDLLSGSCQGYKPYILWSDCEQPSSPVNTNDKANIPPPSRIRLFGLISHKGLEKGRSANQCVLCRHRTKTAYNIVVTQDCVISSCLYCVHRLNLLLIHKKYEFVDLRNEIRRRVDLRYRAPLAFARDSDKFVNCIPARKSADEVYLQTYNKRHDRYGVKLRIHGDEALARLSEVEKWNTIVSAIPRRGRKTASNTLKRKNSSLTPSRPSKKPKSRKFIENDEDSASG